MNIGGGEAADQLVRMMLSGSEVAVRLSGSAIKNMLALTMALAKNHKTISGKVNLVKMLKETRDVRRFSMSPEQYQQFRQRAGKQKILFSAIRDSDNKGKVVDVIMPVTEIDRANMIFERIRYTGQPEQARQDAPSKEQEARVGQEMPQRQQERHQQEETPVTPPVGERQEGDRWSVRYSISRDLITNWIFLVFRRKPIPWQPVRLMTLNWPCSRMNTVI